MEFSRPEYWSGKPFPSPGDLPNPGIKPRSPALQADSSPTELSGKPINSVENNSNKPQLTLEQHRFQLPESTYRWIFSIVNTTVLDGSEVG